MHRVELKVSYFISDVKNFYFVPNAPCGVESCFSSASFSASVFSVPNAPCGVESIPVLKRFASDLLTVPNAPCGVERSTVG